MVKMQFMIAFFLTRLSSDGKSRVIVQAEMARHFVFIFNSCLLGCVQL